MAKINTYPLQHSNILRIYSDKDEVNLSPDYQRNGNIWSPDNKKLLIDSVLNGYDLPKLYFHKLSDKEHKKSGKKMAVIDGRQRMETIWGFIDGEFPLDEEFIYFNDRSVKAGGLTYKDLADKYPKIKNHFDSYTLPIIVVETEDVELIEDMFSRLNDAVPLNAAEKRGAIGGDAAKAINKISKHKFFSKKVSFSNKRYQYKEAAVRLLFLSDCLYKKTGKIIDTKKIYLDNFVEEFKSGKKAHVDRLSQSVVNILEDMSAIFTDKDPLLRAQAAVPIYFLVFKKAAEEQIRSKISRKKFDSFVKEVKDNRKLAEKDIKKANFDLLEYDRLSLQGTNDASSINRRRDILYFYIKG